MAVVRGDAGAFEALAQARPRGQQVHHALAFQMPALEQHSGCAQGQQVTRRVVEVVDAFNLAAQQQRGFVKIGCDHGGQRKELVHQHLHRFAGDQPVAAGGHHHRVEHHMGKAVGADGLRHHAHHLG